MRPQPFESAYLDSLKEILEYGEQKPVFGSDKTVTSIFGHATVIDLAEGFPLLTTKKTFFRGAVEEMLWFLRGSGDIRELIGKKINIWNKHGIDYAEKKLGKKYQDEAEWLTDLNSEIGEEIAYLPLHYTNATGWQAVDKSSDLGIVEEVFIDQTHWVIEQVKSKPFRKSYLVSYWRPDTTYHMAAELGNESVVLPACHFAHHVVVNGDRLDLAVHIRSNDAFLGSPFNWAQYAALAHMYAHVLGYKPGKLFYTANDYHLYSNQIEQASEQLSRQPNPLPQLAIKDRGQKYLTDFCYEDFELLNYSPHPAIKAEVELVGGFE